MVLPALVSLFAAIAVHAEDSPVDWQLPEGWKLTVGEDIQVHSFKIGDEEGTMLFSKWPVPTKTKDVSKALKDMAGMFPGLAKKEGVTLKKDEPEIGEIEGKLFHGSFAVFELKVPADTVQTMFMVHDGKGGVFNGQFTGKTAEWKKGLEVMKTAKAK